MIHPLVLGRGRRLFNGDVTFHAGLRLMSSVTTTNGVIIVTYEPEPEPS